MTTPIEALPRPPPSWADVWPMPLRHREAPTAGGAEAAAGEARRMAQAAAVNRTLDRHLARLDEALRRNGPNLSAVGQAADAHLRGLRSEAGAARDRVDAAVRKSTPSPSPGM